MDNLKTALAMVQDDERGYVLTYNGGTYIRINDLTGRELAVQSQGNFAERGEMSRRAAMLIMLGMVESGEYVELIERGD